MTYNSTIPLVSMRPRTEKRPKQLGSDAQDMVCLPATPSWSEGVQKTPLKIELMNYQSSCNEYGEILEAAGEVGFDAFVVVET